MYRRGGVLLGASGAAFFLVVSLYEAPFRRTSHAAGAASLPEVAAPANGAQPSIRIQHQLIEVAPAARPPARPSTPAAAAVKLARRAEVPDLVTRARRAFLGDGRFRPEPFPRPGR